MTGPGRPALEEMIDRLWLLVPGEHDLAAADRRWYDTAVAVRLGATVHLWASARRVLRQLGGGTAGAGAIAATLASCCRITEVDDIHLGSCTTPGSVVVPVACGLAAAGVPPADLRRGVVVGYEAVVSAAELLGGPFALQRGVWPTRAVAPVAAAAAAAAMLGLGREQAVEALALAAGCHLTGSLPEPARELGLGQAVLAGLTAALGAADGMRGDRRLLARWPGLMLGDAAPGDAAPGDAAQRLPGTRRGDAGAIHDTCVKPFCSARQALAATAAVRGLAGTRGVRGGEVTRIEVGVHPAHLAMVGRRVISSRLDTIASLPYQVALALAREGGLDDVDRVPVAPSGQVATLMEKVAVHADPGLDRMFPESWGATVRLTAGTQVYEASVDGVPSERDFRWEVLEEKAGRLCARAGLEPGEAQHIKSQVVGGDMAELAGWLYSRAMPGPAAGEG